MTAKVGLLTDVPKTSFCAKITLEKKREGRAHGGDDGKGYFLLVLQEEIYATQNSQVPEG